MNIIMKISSFFFFIALTSALFVSQAASSDTRMDGSSANIELFTQESSPELYCLAQNIYFESRADNLAGQYAVADVVLNRVNDTRYPNTICEVIQEGPVSKWLLEEKGKRVPIRNRCQFSWFCDGKTDVPYEMDEWRKAQEIAYNIQVLSLYRGITEGATHYHATYVDPSWNKRMQHIGRIGAHLFFRAP